ncbi:MAG: hypothetical protein GAK33_07605 [Burkholderia lata]|uniref:Uncharacterized protein n=1 Tax=Burkholderia lata (strain ATCC 17760 / DSM 23089 / LMG 22485 / NCIMB 9086 / R18194 / 383) TaxID=482957 RepID=A0A833UUY3_BURL3|nr:MAG: hypothetical protein GAK33_07605 [Burkholderia lata]
MRRFTEFHLCATRAKCAPVSAHLSICRNFTTARLCVRHRVAIPRRRASRSALIGLYACTGVTHREIGTGSGIPKDACETGLHDPIGPALSARARIVQCTNRIGSRKYSPRAQYVHSSGYRRMPVTHGIRYPSLPKTLTFLKNRCASTAKGMAPEKPHRNCLGIKNPNVFRYLCSEGIWLCIEDIPRKASPFDGNPSYDNLMSAPEKSHLCQKVAQQKRDFFQSWRAFRRIRPLTGPEKPHL